MSKCSKRLSAMRKYIQNNPVVKSMVMLFRFDNRIGIVLLFFCAENAGFMDLVAEVLRR